jgi:hypothetical protein
MLTRVPQMLLQPITYGNMARRRWCLFVCLCYGHLEVVNKVFISGGMSVPKTHIKVCVTRDTAKEHICRPA